MSSPDVNDGPAWILWCFWDSHSTAPFTADRDISLSKTGWWNTLILILDGKLIVILRRTNCFKICSMKRFFCGCDYDPPPATPQPPNPPPPPPPPPPCGSFIYYTVKCLVFMSLKITSPNDLRTGLDALCTRNATRKHVTSQLKKTVILHSLEIKDLISIDGFVKNLIFQYTKDYSISKMFFI